MKVNRQQEKVIHRALDSWEKEGELNPEETKRLRGTLTVQPFDWQSLSYYAFILVIFTAITAAFILLANDWLWTMLDQALESPDWFKALVFTLLSAVLFWLALRRRKRKPYLTYTYEAMLLLGALTLGVTFIYGGRQLGIDDEGPFPHVIVLSSFVYGLLALSFRSKLLWVFAILCFSIGFGTETGYYSDWDNLFLGLNYPLRYSLFGLLLVAASYLLTLHRLTRPYFSITLLVSLLQLFLALWLLSIFGNFYDIDRWWQIPQIRFWLWSLLLLGMSLAAILYGIRTHQSIPRDVGISFIFINVYSRFFEYGWDTLHRALFFSLLAVSFWLIGRSAERIWTSIDRGKKS